MKHCLAHADSRFIPILQSSLLSLVSPILTKGEYAQRSERSRQGCTLSLWLGKEGKQRLHPNSGFCLQRWSCGREQGDCRPQFPSPPLALPNVIGYSWYTRQGHPCSSAQLIAASSHGLSMYCNREAASPPILTHISPDKRCFSSHCETTTTFIINTPEKTYWVLLSLLLPCKYHYCCSQESLLY